jgi:nucleoside-diphosphate-sugar epimerase
MWAVHKLTAEHYLQLYSQRFGIHSISLRLANVYGPTVHQPVLSRVVINKVISKAIEGETLITYSNRECIRDYIFLKDVVHAFLLAGAYCGSNKRPFYVIGTGEGNAIEDVWHLIADNVRLHTGNNVPVRFDQSIKIEPMELRNFVADNSQFKDLTGWSPRTELAQGIDITVRAFLSYSGRFL